MRTRFLPRHGGAIVFVVLLAASISTNCAPSSSRAATPAPLPAAAATNVAEIPSEVEALIDTDEYQTMPVPHRYVHGVIPDAKFQLALPDDWNGELVIYTRGFSVTETGVGSFKPASLAKGYAFASTDEGWNRNTIARYPQDSFYESRQRLLEVTVYAKQMLMEQYGKEPTRTIMMGGSNGGHHTKWMVEAFPELYDGGLAGYGYNSQVSFVGSMAMALRNYDVIAPRIDDIVGKRTSDPQWDPARTPLTPALTAAQLKALEHMYDMPFTLADGFAYNAGRRPGTEAQWKGSLNSWLGYLTCCMPRFDDTFNPGGGPLTDDELKQWDPAKSPKRVVDELRKLDVTGNLKRPIIIMHGTNDLTISPGETAGYRRLVEQRLGRANAEQVLAVYYIPGMGHGGPEYNDSLGAQLDALEQWMDYRESGGKTGAPAPKTLAGYQRDIDVQ